MISVASISVFRTLSLPLSHCLSLSPDEPEPLDNTNDMGMMKEGDPQHLDGVSFRPSQPFFLDLSF